MADSYHLINTSGQAVSGSEIAELFEIRPSTSVLTNLNIMTGGGYDTIKISDSNSVGFYATLSGWTDDGYFLNFNGTKYGTYSNPLIYKVSDGMLTISDAKGNFGLSVFGKTDTVGVAPASYYEIYLNRKSYENGGAVVGSSYGDIIEINHSRNSVNAADGNDTITVNSDNNTIEPYAGDDLIIVHGKNNTVAMDGYYLYTAVGNDTLISDGNYNTLKDDEGNNVFISGGYRNVVQGGSYDDTIVAYTYDSELGGDVSIKGGGGNDSYFVSTGLVGVSGENALNVGYNYSTNETLRAIITDFDSQDSIKLRNDGTNAIRYNIATSGIYIYDNTGRSNIVLADQYDWDAVKSAQITLDDSHGNIRTMTLEQANNLPMETAPSGLQVIGNNMTVTSNFSGDLWMLDGYEGTNYNNQNIQEIDATQNPNTMIIAANYQANYIKAGSGHTSLWGGYGVATDTLQGGDNQTMFWFGKNDGSDIILNAKESDTINLYDVNLSDVIYFSATEGNFTLGFSSGTWLTVHDNNTSTPTMKLADGSNWVYNRATGSW